MWYCGISAVNDTYNKVRLRWPRIDHQPPVLIKDDTKNKLENACIGCLLCLGITFSLIVIQVRVNFHSTLKSEKQPYLIIQRSSDTRVGSFAQSRVQRPQMTRCLGAVVARVSSSLISTSNFPGKTASWQARMYVAYFCCFARGHSVRLPLTWPQCLEIPIFYKNSCFDSYFYRKFPSGMLNHNPLYSRRSG